MQTRLAVFCNCVVIVAGYNLHDYAWIVNIVNTSEDVTCRVRS